jgi:hypothetical protein
MKFKNLPVVLAVLALVLSSLACSLAAGEPTLSNIRTAKDQDGNQAASVFGSTDTVYVVADLSDGVAGNSITSVWYAVDVVDVEPNFLIDESTITVEDEVFDGVIYFYFPPPSGEWPSGEYEVEVYFNDELAGTVSYSIP